LADRLTKLLAAEALREPLPAWSGRSAAAVCLAVAEDGPVPGYVRDALWRWAGEAEVAVEPGRGRSPAERLAMVDAVSGGRISGNGHTNGDGSVDR
jgi:hypothetical protein